MKKLFFSVIVATTMLAACGNSTGSGTTASADAKTSSSAAAPADAPVMKFEKPLHDFGKIKTGDKVSYEFKFTNSGKSPLIISDATATCGCTKPEWPRTPVQPGENGSIKVTFDSAGKVGLQDKMITITANTAPAENTLHLVGEVVSVNASNSNTK